jgi:hypothetical protein
MSASDTPIEELGGQDSKVGRIARWDSRAYRYRIQSSPPPQKALNLSDIVSPCEIIKMC